MHDADSEGNVTKKKRKIWDNCQYFEIPIAKIRKIDIIETILLRFAAPKGKWDFWRATKVDRGCFWVNPHDNNLFF